MMRRIIEGAPSMTSHENFVWSDGKNYFCIFKMIRRISEKTKILTLDSGVFFAALPRVQAGFAKLRPPHLQLFTFTAKIASRSRTATGKLPSLR
jgi:hypothetical protein